MIWPVFEFRRRPQPWDGSAPGTRLAYDRTMCASLPTPSGETPHLILVLAPLRGVTGRAFRGAFARHFQGLDLAVAPFVTTVRGERVKPGHLADLQPLPEPALPVVPQVLGKDPVEFTTLLRTLRDLGFAQVDLNAGCPWPQVVRKGRGAGLLADEGALRRMLDAGCAVLPQGLSIKVRLGLTAPDLLPARLPLLNGYPLREVAIHPRTARQMYEGTVDLSSFGACLAACRHPVVYNGDVRTPTDLTRLRRAYPQVRAWMIGRGVVANPFLPEQCRAPQIPADSKRLRAFVQDFTETSRAELHGPASLLGRLKEFWSYLSTAFVGGDRLWQSIRISRRMEEYQSVVDDWFAREPRLSAPRDGLP